MARAPPRTPRPLWAPFLLLCCLAAVPAVEASPPVVVQLVVAFDPANCTSCSEVFQDAVSDTNKKPGLHEHYYFRARPVQLLKENFTRNVQELCAAVNRSDASVSVLISVADARATMAAVAVGGYATPSSVPVLGFAPGYFDHTYQDLNPFFQALNPTLKHMAEALSTFLQRNSWLSATVLLDDSLTSQTLCKMLLNSSLSASTVLQPRTIPRSAHNALTDAKIFRVLSEVVKLRNRVLLVHCEGALVQRIFHLATRLNMITGDWIWILVGQATGQPNHYHSYPVGVLGLRVRPPSPSKYVVKMSVRIVARALRQLHAKWEQNETAVEKYRYKEGPDITSPKGIKAWFGEIRKLTEEAVSGLPTGAKEGKPEASLKATVELLNLVEDEDDQKTWRPLGSITAGRVSLDAVVWPGNTLVGPSPSGMAFWRIVTARSPPFVMTTEALANRTCLVGVPCLQVATNSKDNLSTISADYRAGRDEGVTYNVTCCHGYSMDLLVNIAKELRFEYILYLVADGRFGVNQTNICPANGNIDICSIKNCTTNWDGMMAELVTGAAHMAFAPISVTAWRSHCVDFSVPYYFSSFSFLISTEFRDVPLLAFLAPFSAELWIAIFFSLQATAIAAAAYEWLSPFGLNPWGRQRTKNFSLASALWVTWSLLFSHLVAFKAPKSWPNKVLINLWGCFSVIFLASYTANIAALFAGLFFQTPVNTNFYDQTLLNKKLGAVSGTSAEAYISYTNKMLWNHMQHYNVVDIAEGVKELRNKELDLLVGDTPLLDYYRGIEPGCTLRAVGEIIHQDTYAIAMTKGLHIKDSISALITKYHDNGYLEYLATRWNHGLPCMRKASEMFRPNLRLGIRAVAGVFIMLCLGIILGCIILFFEHFIYKHVLPDLRKKPKGTIWRSPNLMFFSQKLYRFINCVELVSPHHSAKELVNNLRTGQITSLFQKSIKRKEHEQRRRRKSKAQFFEMIQEIRRVQKEGKGSFTSKGGDSSGTLATTPETPSGRPLSILEEDIPETTVFSVGTPNESILAKPLGGPFYMDDSCARLIERVGLKRTPSESASDSSDDETVPCFSPISASLSDLCTIEDDTKVGRCRQPKVHSYDDLKSWTRQHPRQYHQYQKRQQPHPPYPPTSGEKNNFLRQMPLTRFDFFDLPLRLNDSRLKKVSKEDIVFLWQTSERELRRRLQQALADKYEMERRLARWEAQDKPP